MERCLFFERWVKACFAWSIRLFVTSVSTRSIPGQPGFVQAVNLRSKRMLFTLAGAAAPPLALMKTSRAAVCTVETQVYISVTSTG